MIGNQFEPHLPIRTDIIKNTSEAIQNLIKIRTYRGIRHQYAVSVNGQRRNNGSTQRMLGPRRAKEMNFSMARPSRRKK